MSGCVGGCLLLAGIVRTFDITSKVLQHLKRDVQMGQNDTKCKQIARIVANIFYIIGRFCTGLALISMGVIFMSLTPQTSFALGLQNSLFAALPYLIGTLGSLSAGLLIRQIAR